MMNMEMLKTEVYKICSKKVVWIAMVLFLAMFFALQFQQSEKVGVKYTLEPMRAELTSAVENADFHDFVRRNNYACSIDEITQYVPKTIFAYIEQYKNNDRIYGSLRSSLSNTINK